jgi:hypothetical protein
MNSALGENNSAPYMLQSFEDLVNFLEKQSVLYRLIVDEQQKVVIPTRVASFESEIAILWAHNHSLVQCIHPLPFKVREERIPEIESAIVRLNDAFMLPGFGFSYNASYISYRLSMPIREGGISVNELKEIFDICVNTSAEFCDLFSEIEAGAIDASEILEFAGLIFKKKVNNVY